MSRRRTLDYTGWADPQTHAPAAPQPVPEVLPMAPERPQGGLRAPEPVDHGTGLVRGAKVRVGVAEDRTYKGTLAAIDEDGLALSQSPYRAPLWIDWEEVHWLRTGQPGPRYKPGEPRRVDTIRAMVMASETGVIRASVAYATLYQKYGWGHNALRVARRRAGVDSYWDPLYGEWMWRFGPSARDEDDALHGVTPEDRKRERREVDDGA